MIGQQRGVSKGPLRYNKLLRVILLGELFSHNFHVLLAPFVSLPDFS